MRALVRAACYNGRVSGRVLLIEDDHELGTQIVSSLRAAGYEPTWWKEGKSVPTSAEFDLVVLDLMLPGMTGMEILRELRTHAEMPVLVLSAKTETADKVAALQLGAYDYMTKPFWPEELIERVRARLRRPTLQRNDQAVEAGPVRIDLASHEVRVHGKVVELTRVEFDFLTALARRPGIALTRKWLAENILDPERRGDERTLDVHVSRLRKKLGVAVVETVWGIGYRLATGKD